MTEPHRDSRRGPLPLDDPRLLSFLPMLYVAWADGDLSEGEISEICRRTGEVGGLNDDCQGTLGRWLDPADPPGPRELHRLLATIRAAGSSLDRDTRRSLAELGRELARAGGHQPTEAELAALAELDGALVVGKGTARRLLVEGRPRPSFEPPAAAFEVAAMGRLLDGRHRELRRRLRRLLCEERFRTPREVSREEYRAWVLERLRELAERGFGALSYPTEVGGGDDLEGFVAAFETLAIGDLSLLVKFGVQFGLFGGAVLQLGEAPHHLELLPAVGRLELPGCFAMTEIGHGSNVADLATVARYDAAGDQLVVTTPDRDAMKDYIGNAARDGRMAVVFAQLEVAGEAHGVHALLVPIRDAAGEPLPGVTIEDCGEKMGLGGVDNGRLAFDGVRVPRTNLLSRFAEIDAGGTYNSPIASPSKRFFTMLGTLVGGRVSVAKAGAAAARLSLTIAVRYGERRHQFGPDGEPEVPILDYLTHQRRLMPPLATSYALAFALDHLTERYAAAEPDERREVEVLAAGLKAYATRHAADTIQTCREACGGWGYLAQSRLPDLKADTDVFTTFEGDNTVLLQLVARGLLSQYKRQFESMNLIGMVRYLADRAAAALGEINPLAGLETGEDHLRGEEFQLAALRYREQRLLATVARRLKERLDGGMDPFAAMVECQDHLVTTALAHVERLILERFTAAIDERREHGDAPELVAMLDTLRQLYALSRIEAGRGWFLEKGYLHGNKSEAIRGLVNRLCGEVRGQAYHLVDAFAIPEPLLPERVRS